MKKVANLLKTVLLSRLSPVFFALFSAIGVILNYSYRVGYIFVDGALFSNFSMMLFVFAVAATVILTFIGSFSMKNSKICNKKAIIAFQIIAEIFTIIIGIYNIVNIIVGKRESFAAALGLFKQSFPFWLACLCVASALFVIPYLKSKSVKKALCAITAAIMLFSIYASIFQVVPFEFESSPAVFDNGNGYSVVFATSDKSVAYVEYDYNGRHIKKFDEDNGRKIGDRKVHSIQVPYKELSNNSYNVGATRVIDELSYGGRLGKTIKSENIKFNDNFGDDVNLLTISDWHTHNKLAKQTIKYLGNYNAVALLGDSAPGIMFEDDVANYLVSFAGDLTEGKIPVIFVRGNHETRGEMASHLSSLLKMDKFYYKTSLGNYDFIVLDSSEDKDDSHPEYGSMDVYGENRKKMVKWLDSLENSNKKTIAMSHAKEICMEEDLSKNAYDKLESLNTSFLACGHEHISEFTDSSPFPILIDGGIDADGSGTYVASMLKLTPQNITVISVDSNNKTLVNETVK